MTIFAYVIRSYLSVRIAGCISVLFQTYGSASVAAQACTFVVVYLEKKRFLLKPPKIGLFFTTRYE